MDEGALLLIQSIMVLQLFFYMPSFKNEKQNPLLNFHEIWVLKNIIPYYSVQG